MNPTTQADLGTPASLLEETVTIEIDGLPATVKAGSTIMRAARESGEEWNAIELNISLPTGNQAQN